MLLREQHISKVSASSMKGGLLFPDYNEIHVDTTEQHKNTCNYIALNMEITVVSCQELAYIYLARGSICNHKLQELLTYFV